MRNVDTSKPKCPSCDSATATFVDDEGLFCTGCGYGYVFDQQMPNRYAELSPEMRACVDELINAIASQPKEAATRLLKMVRRDQWTAWRARRS